MASRSPLEEERATALEVLIARTKPTRDRDLCDLAHPAFLSLAVADAGGVERRGLGDQALAFCKATPL
jgi:hypothetical protein